MTAPAPLPTWADPDIIRALIDPTIAEVTTERVEYLTRRALRDFASIAAIPTDPGLITPGRADQLRDAVRAYIEWYETTSGGTGEGITIGHVTLPERSTVGTAVRLPRDVYGYLRAAGVLRITRAGAY